MSKNKKTYRGVRKGYSGCGCTYCKFKLTSFRQVKYDFENKKAIIEIRNN